MLLSLVGELLMARARLFGRRSSRAYLNIISYTIAKHLTVSGSHMQGLQYCLGP